MYLIERKNKNLRKAFRRKDGEVLVWLWNRETSSSAQLNIIKNSAIRLQWGAAHRHESV